MHISRITLQGFKSFPEKTTLEFGSGISAVVGPNGCGKSNVLDALRWCFGTQSPKQLRSGSMQDVIFSGASRHPPMGFAEVSVTFAAEGEEAPEPWRGLAEICITRRIDRSGDSEYKINNARVRLRDIQDFLMDIGYGDYSIVQQGQITQLVQAKPDDVRYFIEQASRMTKFRARREEAQNKLARTEENLERILDLINEIERQLNSLKRQAEKAQKAKEIDAQLQQVCALLLSRNLLVQNSRMQELKAELTTIVDALRQARTEISKYEADQEELHSAQEGAEAEFQSLFQRQRQLQELRGELQARLSALANEQKLRTQEATAAQSEIDSLSVEIVQVNRELADIEPKLQEHEAFLQEHQKELETLSLAVREKSLKLDNLRHNQETTRSMLMRAQEMQVDLRSAENQARLTLQYTQERLAALDRETAELNERLSAEHHRLAMLEQNLGQAQQSAGTAEATHNEALNQLRGLRQALESKQQERGRLLRDLQDRRIERDKVVTALAANPTVAQLAQELAQGLTAPWSKASPKAGVEDLIETVLADRFSALLLETPELGLSLLETLRSGNNNERVRWFDAASAKLIQQNNITSSQPPSGCTPVSDLLQIQADQADWVRALTAGIYISETPLLPNMPLPSGSWDVLWDRQGASVNRYGIWSSGPLSQQGTAHLAARRDQLQTENDRLESSLRAAESEISYLEEAVRTLQQKRDQLAEALQNAQRTTADLHHEFGLIRQGIERLERDAEACLQSRGRLLEQQAQAQKQLETAVHNLATTRQQFESAQQQLENIEAEMLPLDKERLAAEAARDELRLQIDSRREQLVLLSRHVEAARERRAGHERRIDQLRRQLEFSQQRSQEISTEAKSLTARVDEHNEQLLQLSKAIEEIRTRQATLRERQLEIEKGIRVQNQMLDRLQQEQNKKEQELADIRHSVNSSVEQFSLRFGVDFAQAAPSQLESELSNDELLAQQTELEAKRARLGAINPAALEEYQETKERYDAMTAQREDLLHSIEKLRESIRSMNKESRDKFKTAFETVNKHFGEIFVKLFRGGRAELQLTNPEDWLDSGVIIVAQPPGTNLQRLELLSGGQSAMTAISLILAIFLTYPSPFCILDEVDAPLDDTNVSRFNQVLIEMNEQAQILMVTHNKQSMEIADTLYGITMEQRGISKAISVHLA